MKIWAPCTTNFKKKTWLFDQTQTQTIHYDTKNTNAQPRLINLTNTTFTKENINILALGPIYALEKDPKHYINKL